MLLTAAGIAGISPQQLDREAMIPAGRRARPTSVFPFRLRRQPIALALECISRNPHPLVVFPALVGYIAPLVLWNLLLLAQPVAVGRGAEPAHGDHRTAQVRAVLRQNVLCQAEVRVLPREPLVLRHAHLLSGDGKPPGDDSAMGRLAGIMIGLVRWRAHPEVDRSLDFDEGLTLAVDVPAAVT